MAQEQWIDEDEWVDEEWVDEEPNPDPAPSLKASTSVEEPSFLRRAWNELNQPLVNLPNNELDAPRLNTPVPYARLKGLGAGVVQGIGDVVSSLTSPVNLATSLLTLGSGTAAKVGMSNAARLLGLGSRYSGIPMALGGGDDIIEGAKAGDFDLLLLGS